MTDEARPITIKVNGRLITLANKRIIVLGRDPQADVTIEDERISRRHAELVRESDGWTFRDLGSSNGSYARGKRITEMRIEAGDEIVLGGLTDGIPIQFTAADVELERAPIAAAGEAPSRLGLRSGVHPLPARRLSIGRASDNDLVLDDLLISRYHAVVEQDSSGHYEVVDVGSHNGVFVNGRREKRIRLNDGDVVTFGTEIYRFVGGRLEQYIDKGAAWLCASGLTVVTSDQRRILDNVSFALEPASLLAVVGPSGSGKTTLVNAVTGFRPATEGIVQYGGRDLYASYDDLRHRMGYVPQEDLIHRELTVRQALDYAAELRFPRDVERKARLDRVDEVTVELGISERALLPIHQLSGGQRKRTSVAVELLTKPSLLFLDEPTSGLDPGSDEQLMMLLRDLAHGGRIVVVVTHSLDGLDLCDRVMFLAPGGTLAFYGPPAEAREFFARTGAGDRYATIFRGLSTSDGRERSRMFEQEPAYDRYVRRPLASAELGANRGSVRAPTSTSRVQSPLRQLLILMRRYGSIMAADRRALIVLALQVPLFAILFVLLYSTNRISPDGSTDAMILMWLLAVGATYIGTSNSIREIVKERPIFRRERAVGLSRSAYLGSKVLVLGSVGVLQGALLVAFATLHHNLGGPGTVFSAQRPELMLTGGVAAFAAVAFGLMLSSLARTPDQASLLLPIVLVAQMLFSAPLANNPVLSAVGTLSSARWATNANASTIDLNNLQRDYNEGLRYFKVATEYARKNGYPSVRDIPPVALPELADQVESLPPLPSRSDWAHTTPVWLGSIAAMLILSGAAIAVAFLLLRRGEEAPSAAPRARPLMAGAPAAESPTP